MAGGRGKKKRGGPRGDGGGGDGFGNGNRNGNGNGKGKGKGNNLNNNSRCGNFVDLSQTDKLKDGSELLGIYEDAKVWYDTFTASISKKDIAALKESAAKAKVSWEVASMIAQIDMLYGRVEAYKAQAEELIRQKKLDGAVGRQRDAALLDKDGKDVTGADFADLNELFKEDELKYASVKIRSKIVRSKADIAKIADAAASRTYERVRDAIALYYDRLNNAFYVGFDTEEMPGGLRIMVRFVIRDGELKDMTGHDASAVPLDNTVFITNMDDVFKSTNSNAATAY